MVYGINDAIREILFPQNGFVPLYFLELQVKFISDSKKVYTRLM